LQHILIFNLQQYIQLNMSAKFIGNLFPLVVRVEIYYYSFIAINYFNDMKTKLVCVLALVLSGCAGDMRSTLGMRKEAPDEYVVVSYPPLQVPPSMSDLRDVDSSNKNYLFKNSIRNIKHVQQESLSQSDEEFLSRVSAKSNANSKAKLELQKENHQSKLKNISGGPVSKAISKVRGDGVDPVIDPISERERLQNNMQEGRQINEGEVKNKSSSTLQRIFSN
jgi:hypothetical protein